MMKYLQVSNGCEHFQVVLTIHSLQGIVCEKVKKKWL